MGERIDYNGTTLGTVEFIDFSGDRSAVYPRLTIRVRIRSSSSVKEELPYWIRDVRGSFVLLGPGNTEHRMGHVGVTDTTVPVRFYPGGEQQVNLVCDLDHSRLAAAERARATHPHRDLAFRLDLSVPIDGDRGPNAQFVQLRGEYPQSEWLKVLYSMGWGRVFAVEIAAPRNGEEGKFREALARFSEARASLDEGRSSLAVGACRQAMDLAANAFGEDGFTEDAWQRVLGPVEHTDKREAFKALFRALRDLGNLGIHPVKRGRAGFDGTKSAADFTRAEGEFMIRQTALVLGLLGELHQELPKRA